MDKGKPKVKLKPRSEPITTKAGFKRTMVAIVDGKEIHLDEVKLWQAKSREDFAKRCTKALNGNLPPKDTEELQKRIDELLRQHETGIKAQIQSEKKEQSATSSNGGKPKEMSKEERKEALALLKDPELLGRVQDDLTKMGIVDEERNKVLIYLIATSRKMPQGLAGTLKASSSAGKNHLLNSAVSLIPPEDVKEFTYLSPKALHYMGEDGIKNKLVICTEIAGREGAEYAVRTLISEPYITCAIPVRNQDGGPFQTQEFKVNGPIAYLDTTTSFKLHPEKRRLP